MDLIIGIVSYNTRDLTCQCIDSVLNATATFQKKLVVADTGSKDGTVEALARLYPNVSLFSVPDNPGYGTALNIILADHQADFFLAMNADVILDPKSIVQLHDYIKQNPQCGLVGPSLIWAGGKHQRSCKKFPTIHNLIIELFALDRFFPIDYMLPNLDYNDSKFKIPTTVDALSGSVMLIRTEAFRHVNGFDSGFRLYFEEIDLCRRLRSAGYRVAFVPQAKAIHVHAASTRQTLDRQITYYLSSCYYASKHFSPPSARVLLYALKLSTMLRMAALTVKYFPTTKNKLGILANKQKACLDLLRELHLTAVLRRRPVESGLN